MSNLKEKLNGTKAIVYSIRSDKHGNDTFICVQDNRKFNISFLRFEGSLNIFILSSIIAPQHRPEKYKDMPYLESRFVGEKIELYELHSDIIEEEYENRGYATMMLDTLLEIARKSNCTLITGHLTQEDAKTEKQKNKRNNFYKNYKTAKVELTFENDLEREGTLRIHLL